MFPAARRAAAVALPAALAVALTACTASTPPTPPAPAWVPCPDSPALQCASIAVPLDHDDPDGATIELAVARLPAAAPAPGTEPRSVVLHRGGPGYGTVDYLKSIASGALPSPVGPAVRAGHDLVALDQRGTGGSGPALPCVVEATAKLAAASTDPAAAYAPGRRAGLAPFPDVGQGGDAAQAALGVQVERDGRIRAECLSGPEAEHLGSDDAARDLDLVRAALGDERLTMVGQSYGAYLAAVYAARFPERVGRLVLDSPVDPVARAGADGTAAGRAGSDVESERALDDLLARCAAAGPACPFGRGDPAGTLDGLLERLRTAPVELRTADGATVRLTAPHVIELLGMGVYQPSIWSPIVVPYLEGVTQAVADPASPAATQVAEGVRATDLRPDDPVLSGFEAVACAEVPGPADAQAWATAVGERVAVAPRFAALRASETLPCVGDEREAAEPPSFGERPTTDGEVLVLSNRIDPATPLSGARATAALFDQHALVVNQGTGHVAAQQSRCAAGIADAFLAGGPLPAPGTTCLPDRDPFAPS